MWVCEFCSYQNKVDLEEGEKPTDENINFVIQAAPKKVVTEEKKEGETVGASNDDDLSTNLFAIDISGSMNATVGNGQFKRVMNNKLNSKPRSQV